MRSWANSSKKPLRVRPGRLISGSRIVRTKPGRPPMHFKLRALCSFKSRSSRSKTLNESIVKLTIPKSRDQGKILTPYSQLFCSTRRLSVLSYFLFLLPDDMLQLIDHQFNCFIELMTLGSYMGGMAPAKVYIAFDGITGSVLGNSDEKIHYVFIGKTDFFKFSVNELLSRIA